MIIDSNYNCIVTLDNGQEELLFADRLHNENLDYWKGWQCASGYSHVSIKPNFDVFGSLCENDYLGNLEKDFRLLDQYTICNRNRCIACTSDLMLDKFLPKDVN